MKVIKNTDQIIKDLKYFLGNVYRECNSVNKYDPYNVACCKKNLARAMLYYEWSINDLDSPKKEHLIVHLKKMSCYVRNFVNSDEDTNDHSAQAHINWILSSHKDAVSCLAVLKNGFAVKETPRTSNIILFPFKPQRNNDPLHDLNV